MRDGHSDVDQKKGNGQVDLEQYQVEAEKHEYIERLENIEAEDARKFLDVGIDTNADSTRAGTFIQKDMSVIHSRAGQPGVAVMAISQGLATFPWLSEYLWRNINPDSDSFTALAKARPHEGYLIRAEKGVQAQHPVQACLYIAKEGFSQHVHNIVIAEEGSNLQVITGCATSPHLVSGLHVGVSEFYVKKGAQLHFTMIHDWGKEVNVRPRTYVHVPAHESHDPFGRRGSRRPFQQCPGGRPGMSTGCGIAGHSGCSGHPRRNHFTGHSGRRKHYRKG